MCDIYSAYTLYINVSGNTIIQAIILIKSYILLKKNQKKKIVIFLIFAHNIDCGYKLEPPHRGGSNVSNEYLQSIYVLYQKLEKKV